MKITQVSSWLLTIALLGSVAIFCAPISTHAQEKKVQISPSAVVQGEPVLITLPDISSIVSISSAKIEITNPNTKKTESGTLFFSLYKNIPTAVYGVDINAATGTAKVTVTLKKTSSNVGSSTITGEFLVTTRAKYSLPLPVPEKLGGNSATNTARVVSVLSKENTDIAKIVAKRSTSFWTTTFAYPIHGQVLVTDPYGYLRDTGTTNTAGKSAATITHKGTDFRAPIGTPVYAINNGVVRLAKTYTVYGKTIIIDHGLGIESLYMHLSKIRVTPGTSVKKGTLIGFSGDTGYAEAAHLHLSIKVDGTSIDPMKFFDLFNPQLY